MISKITFPNKSSILYNSNSESFVGLGSVVVEEDDFDLEEALARLERYSEKRRIEIINRSVDNKTEEC